MRGQTIIATLIPVAMAVTMQRTAYASPRVLAALAPASDARKAVAIGPSGQVYEPDGKGSWVRKRLGGTAVEITTATTIGGTVIAGTKGAPPFKLKGGAWTAVFLAPKAKAIIGSGPRALAAVGKSVFALHARGGEPTKLADAPNHVLALGASASGAVIMTDKGMLKLEGGTAWKPVKKAPKTVRALIGDRWALLDKGALDLKTLKTIAWPAGVRIDEAAAIGDTLVVVAKKGKQLELLTVAGGKIAREPIPLDDPPAIVGVVIDGDKRCVVAGRDGRLALRVGGTWSVSTVRDELPADKPGPAPAASAATP